MCQRVHRGAGVAVPANIRTMLNGKKGLVNKPALFVRYTYGDWQGGFKAPGNLSYQRHLLSCFSTQPQHTRQEGPNISLLNPALQRQWDHARNAHLGNTIIKPYNNQKVWWTCDRCPDGHLHSWSATVNGRSRGSGCPQCSGRKVCKHNSLATKAPKVAAQWDCDTNIGTPDSVVAQGSQPVGWRCDACGYKWSAAPSARVSKSNSRGCPSCEATRRQTKHPTFAECGHPLLAEWDHKRNATHGNRPDNVTLGSKKHIFWLCTKCPAGQEHSWSAMPRHRCGHGKTGCPFCAAKAACRCNSLQALCPDIAAQWDHSRNPGQPSDYSAGSDHAAWWFCPQRGSWQQGIHSRVRGQRGPVTRLKRGKVWRAV